MTQGQLAYREFLKSDFWKNLTEEKRKTIDRCEYCGHTDYLECHHKFYRDNWYETQLNDLLVLCKRCHPCFHDTGFTERRNQFLRSLDDGSYEAKQLKYKIKKKLQKLRRHGNFEQAKILKNNIIEEIPNIFYTVTEKNTEHTNSKSKKYNSLNDALNEAKNRMNNGKNGIIVLQAIKYIFLDKNKEIQIKNIPSLVEDGRLDHKGE